MFRRNKTRAKKAASAPASLLAPGGLAPDFRLPATTGAEVSLSEYRGQPVILVFYPAAWSPVCGDQLTLYNELLPLFGEYQAQVLAVSVDGIWSQRAFAENRNIGFPLLADFEPKGAVARAYGVYDAEGGHSERALFLTDSEGTIRWSHVSPVGVNPGADGILIALEAL